MIWEDLGSVGKRVGIAILAKRVAFEELDVLERFRPDGEPEDPLESSRSAVVSSVLLYLRKKRTNNYP